MAFQNMIGELHGTIPKIPFSLCKTYINRAWTDVRRQNLWSFQLFDGNWVSPVAISAGHVSITQGLNTITFDATAKAAINAVGFLPTPITQRQFRPGSVTTIYNIWAYNAGTGVATLDRPVAENTQSLITYQLLQCYYPAPMADFLCWTSVRDMVNFNDLFTYRYNREELDGIDPQRSSNLIPSDVVYYAQDSNPASPTYRFPMFELWGQPTANLVYQLYGLRRGVDLVNPTDTLPPAVTEDCVLALAKVYGYQWAEANKGDHPRNMGPDWKYLMGEAKTEYARLYKDLRKKDRNTVDNWYAGRRTTYYTDVYTYSSASQTAWPGSPPL